jgi:class 3 adenylate cyclase/tetratricopeptide (TPR) repeat protein
VQICPACGEQNPERFRLCGICGSPLAPQLPPQETRKIVTVVFSDLKGSTSLGETLDSESLREVMSRYFDEMRVILQRHGGTVEKYIGDAIMAVFGLPRVQEDDALRAVRAAHQMKQALAELNDELERVWGVRLANRTGVNTGEVVAGDPTTGQRLVTGDTVNVAARLEQAAPALEVLIGAPTYRLVREAVAVEEVEPLELKGKVERVPAYRLLEVTADKEGMLRRHEALLVGRERELALLLGAADAAFTERRCGVATIVGDAGLGKSRLGEEVLQRVAGFATSVRGRCLPYGEGITFWPLVEAIREAAGINERDDAASARAKLAALAGPGADDAVNRVVSAVGLSDQQFAVQELFWGIRRLFTAMASRRPLVVTFEDLHWAEDTFLELVEHLLETVDDAPVFLLCTARPDLLEHRPDWADSPRSVRVALEPLSDAAAEHVVANLLGDVGLDDAVRSRIVAAAEGNPLFVEQLLSMMIDEGFVVFEGGSWQALPDLPAVAIPPTIQALLAARLDALEREERAVIEPASVAGYVFPEDAVRELAPDVIRADVEAHLGALSRKQLVRPDPAERSIEAAYRFHHALIRDTTYDGLLKRARASLHKRFVAWADRVNGDRALEYEEILGYHLEQAHRYLVELAPADDHAREVGADAARRLISAGRRASSRGDLPAAGNLLERAARLLPELDTIRLEILPELGETLVDLGRFEDARVVLDDAAASARTVSDTRVGAHALLIQLLLQLRAGEVEQWTEVAVPQIEVAIEVFTRADDHLGLAKAYRVLGYVHGTACRYGAAAEACERGLEYARLAGSAAEERLAATSYALAACLGPTPVDEAVAGCEAILEQVRSNRLSGGWVLCLLANLSAMRGDFDRARRAYREGRAAIQEVAGEGWHLAWSALSASRVEMLAGDPETAERQLRDAADLLERVGERYLLSTITALLARSVLALGRTEEAAELTVRAEELAGDDDVESQAEWRAVRAKVRARQGALDEAARLAQDALQLLLPTDSVVMTIDILCELGDVFSEIGNPSAAWAYREALALAERKGDAVAAADAENLLQRIDAAATAAD